MVKVINGSSAKPVEEKIQKKNITKSFSFTNKQTNKSNNLNNNMGTTLTVDEGWVYYNSTLNTTDWEIIFNGFATAANAELDMPNATVWSNYGSLSIANSYFTDMHSMEQMNADGFGSAVGLTYMPFKERWDNFHLNCDAAYSCVDSTIVKFSDRDLQQTISFNCKGMQSCENITVYGNRSIVSFVNGTSNSNMNVIGSSAGLLSMKNGLYWGNGWAKYIGLLYEGVYDGYGGTIYCNNYTQCDIYCYGAHSCYGLYLLCDDTSICNVDYCDNDHIWCPLGYYTINQLGMYLVAIW